MGTIVTASERSLERLVPDTLSDQDATGMETLALHVERYEFATKFVPDGRVLDCACGVGYGSAILAAANGSSCEVRGVDIDPLAVAHARQNYADDNVSFEQGDGALLHDDEGFELIVSLETIEHVPDPERLMGNFESLLKPEGILIASVPVTPSVDVNPYHLHDFTKRSFRRMGAKLGLEEIDHLAQNQPFSPWKIASGSERRLDDMRPNIPAYYLQHPTALTKRVWSTFKDGFRNKYLTLAWRKPPV